MRWIPRTVEIMDNRAEVREFLISRRAKITPQQAGMPDVGAAVFRACVGARSPPSPASVWSTTPSWSAALSAVSPPPCSTPSPVPCSSTTPNAPTCSTSPTPRTGPVRGCGRVAGPVSGGHPRPSLTWVLDAITAPAIARNGRMDLLAANDLGRAMHAAVYASAAGAPPNFARFTFLDLDAAQDFYPRWEIAADTCVAILRTEAGRDPTTRPCTTSSGSCPRGAATSAADGAATTSASTAPAASCSTTAWSAILICPTKVST